MSTFALGALLPLLAVALVVHAADIDYRLKPNVVPDAYDITIRPYLLAADGANRFTFDGDVSITLHAVLAGTREIQLHKDYIDISGASLYDSNGQVVQNVDVSQLTYDDVTDLLVVPLQNQLKVMTSYTLRFVYKGQIRDGMEGFFRATYTDADGVEKWIGVTQAQRINARSIFPCFDEPAFKATFRMHISRPKQYNSVFNTRLIGSAADGEDRYLDSFEETPVMSTYLVAFIVSEFDSRGSNDLVIITRPEYSNKTDFAYSVAERALTAYNNYTRLPYKELGNPIMQKATSPKFPYNGMENWGLVIYGDSVLVQEPGYTDGWANKEYTIAVVVHETAHMWFGNSVTFSWWSYFWLNEAFARYYQYFMAHELYPEYQLDEQFVVNQVHSIFETDAVNSTQPLTSPENSIQSPAQVASKFSALAYAKGASVVRMIRNIMGQESYDNAIRDYLKANHLGNVIPSDLFYYFELYWPTTSPPVNLKQFFHDWTEQVGYPVLGVTVGSNGRTITLQQKRFLLAPDDGSDAALTYTIPITYTTDTDANFNDLTPKFYFNGNVTSHDFQIDKSFKWIIFNLQQSNYHRVFYDTPTLWNIQTALRQSKHSGIPATNRAQLVDDLFNFARVGLVDYDLVFQFIEYLTAELDYLPWHAAFAGLQRVAQRLTLAQLPAFSRFLFDITAPVYEKLGFRSGTDTVLDVYNRKKVVSWLCKYNRPDCAGKAQEIMLAVEAGGVKPSPDFRETVYCAAARSGEVKFYNTLERWFHAENVTSEKAMLVRAMGCTRYFMDTHYMRILLGLIPAEYAVEGIAPMYKENPENVTPAFNGIKSTIEKLAEIVGWPGAADIVSDIANYFTNSEQKESLAEFIEAKGALFGSSVSKLQNAVKTVDSNLQWAEKRLGTLLVYLDMRNAASLNGCMSLLFLLATAIYVSFS